MTEPLESNETAGEATASSTINNESTDEKSLDVNSKKSTNDNRLSQAIPTNSKENKSTNDNVKQKLESTTVKSESHAKPSPTSKIPPTIAPMEEMTDKNDTLHTMSFNQDGGCLAVGTASGFRICNVHPFHETFRRRLDGGLGDCGGGEFLLCILLDVLHWWLYLFA
jgi:hypothetical protein